MTAKNYPHLLRFLADHFGGYESAQAAIDLEADGNADVYLSGFTRGLDRVTALDVCELLMARYPDPQVFRDRYEFEDTGNPKQSMAELDAMADHQLPDPDLAKGFRLLAELLWMNN